MSFDGKLFRAALGRFPTGVAIITGATDSGERLGMTVSSFNSVSLDPPLILFSLARTAHSFAAWTTLHRYAVNILSEQQEDLSNRFARPLADKWAGMASDGTPSGPPLIANALAAFECEAYARYDGGDHDIFVGRVISLRTSQTGAEDPLVFFGGRYRRLDSGFRDVPPHDASIIAGWS